MIEADVSMTQMAFGQRMGPEGDTSVYAEFRMHPRRNEQKSKAEGRDIYEDQPYIKIMVPGDKGNIVNRPIREQDKTRFPRQWAAFKNAEEQIQEGTPLHEWAGISRSQVEELKFLNIRTVEALAGMPENHGAQIMGFQGIRAKAKAYLEDSKMMAPIAALTEENQVLRQQLADLQQQVGALMQQAAGVEEPPNAEGIPKRRRGRTRKVQVDDATIQDDNGPV